ncbi:unnamed protein product [Rotaria socialis]|uniref:Uncharacterized protein n=1 Tax=Rotaria socialis TaxID=392032 RepID=A0A817SS50_9BILA|nr:unnamed protein product [Rotaria socialis]CAF4497718.1 unnamed protein product [Rotaria socialis]
MWKYVYNAGQYRYGFNTQEKTDEIAGAGNHTTALFWEYDTRSGRRWNLDPKPQVSISDYAVNGNNPILNNDPNGDWCIPCLTAGAGALIGAGVEAGTQLYQTGKINNWKAVGGAAVQGAVTGFAAGATGGASLFSTIAVSGAANALGGAASNAMQGKAVTTKTVATDIVVGLATGGVGKAIQYSVNKQVAKSFYKEAGFEVKKAAEHIEGINLLKNVKITTLKEGKGLQQWTKQGRIGDYFTNMENGARQNLGLPDYEKRTIEQFSISKDVRVLESEASKLNGNRGGGTQYFSPEIKNNIKPLKE